MIEKCNLSGDYFSAYLHQNYLEFFSEISDVVRASEYLSDSDFMTFEWSVSIRSFVTIKENHCLSLNLKNENGFLIYMHYRLFITSFKMQMQKIQLERYD